MPKKTCPQCDKQHGTRKKVCECGHSFSTSAHPLYPEPGGWVIDRLPGMPKIEPPDPLPRERKIDADELRDQYIAYEGLGYCLYSYIEPEHINDATLRSLWKKARLAMRDIVSYLETVR